MHAMDDRIGVAGTTAVWHRENKTARKDQTVGTIADRSHTNQITSESQDFGCFERSLT